MSERPPISPRSPRAALEPERVPPPPKRSERARNPFVVVGNAIITIVLVLMIGAGGVYVYGKQKLEAPGPLREDKVVNIPARAGMTDIAEILQREGVIDNNRWAFIGSVFALKARSELKPGEYSFQKNASLRDVIGTIVEGKVVQHAVTIPEGLTSEQILARLSENDIFAGAVREMPREGTLLPETYKFPRGTSRDQVIARMQQTQKRVLAEIWERRNPDIPVKTPEQLVTLASIVEKETGKADERSRVAAVFVNRLRQKIKLQSDPTIIYGLVGGRGTLGRPIKRSKFSSRRPITPTWLRAFRRGRSPIPARLAGSRGQSGAHPRPVLRRGRHRRSCLYRDLRPASEERRQASHDGKADSERHRRTYRRSAAACGGRAGGRGPHGHDKACAAEKACPQRCPGPAGRGTVDGGASGGPAIA
jgi:UPF0755 protein